MRYLLTVILSLMLCSLSYAAVYSVTVETANVISEPVTAGGYVVVEVPRYYPLTSNSEEDGFYRVNDFQGLSGWISKSNVDQTRSVVVTVPNANVRARPATSHRILFRAAKGVAFKVLEETPQWFRVEHESGKSG